MRGERDGDGRTGRDVVVLGSGKFRGVRIRKAVLT